VNSTIRPARTLTKVCARQNEQTKEIQTRIPPVYRNNLFVILAEVKLASDIY
jgi:hypothetical protein